MNFGWQDAVALGVAVAAAIYVIRRLRRLGRGKQRPGCGGCADCPDSSGRPPLVSIAPPQKDGYGDKTTA